jgi:hypothetical protein
MVNKNKNNNNNNNNINNNNNSTIWYEHDPKCTHFSVSIFIQLLARCFISFRGEIWAHRTSFTVSTIPESNRKIAEKDGKSTPLKLLYIS